MHSQMPASPHHFSRRQRGRRAILTGQVLPTTAGDKDIQDAFEGAPIIGTRADGGNSGSMNTHCLSVR